MGPKGRLLLILSAVTVLASVSVLAPSSVAAQPLPAAPSECTNTSCYGQPLCNYDLGWNCFLGGTSGGGYCDGNEKCKGSEG